MGRHLKHLLPEIYGAIKQLWGWICHILYLEILWWKRCGMWSMQQTVNETTEDDSSFDSGLQLPIHHMIGKNSFTSDKISSRSHLLSALTVLLQTCDVVLYCCTRPPKQWRRFMSMWRPPTSLKYLQLADKVLISKPKSQVTGVKWMSSTTTFHNSCFQKCL